MTKRKLKMQRQTLSARHLTEKPSEVIEAKEVSWLKQKGRFLIQLPFLSRFFLKKAPTRAYLITMLFGNGTSKTWAIKTGADRVTFKFAGQVYYLDYEEAYFDLSLNQYHLLFHERFSTPINREIYIETAADGTESPYACVTPGNLQKIIEMKYVQAVAGEMSGSIPLWLILIGVGLILFLLFFKGGG